MSNQGWGQSPGGFGQPPGGGFGQPPAGGYGQPSAPQGWGPAPDPGGAYRSPGAMPPGQLTEQERMWGMLAHFSTFVVGIFGPMILMMVDPAGAPSAFVKHHAKQALLWSVAMIVVAMLTCGIGAFVMMIWQVMAGVAANRGEWYVYPGLGGFVDSPPQQ